MAIDINGNCVVFNGEALCSTPSGAEYGGVICHQGFCDIRKYQGSVSGYGSGGIDPAGPTIISNIEKFPFSSDTNSVDIADISQARYFGSGHSSPTDGFTTGGRPSPSPPGSRSDVIDCFPFASDTNATDVGEFGTVIEYAEGAVQSIENAYVAGGRTPLSNQTQAICKFPFSAVSTQTAVGNLSTGTSNHSGHSSSTHGYVAGGYTTDLPSSAGRLTRIDKWSFSSDTNASNIATAPPKTGSSTGASSSTHGYINGGNCTPGPFPTIASLDVIQKFTFASDANATDVGEMTTCRDSSTNASSDTNGYISGGSIRGGVTHSSIDKFPFASDTSATCIADLTQPMVGAAGHQV